jgi:hypothetical protein
MTPWSADGPARGGGGNRDSPGGTLLAGLRGRDGQPGGENDPALPDGSPEGPPGAACAAPLRPAFLPRDGQGAVNGLPA